jgi:hypothetical protein
VQIAINQAMLHQICCLYCVCLNLPTSPVPAHCPHSLASGVVVFVGFVRLVLVWFLWLVFVVCGHCQVVTGCSRCHLFFAFLAAVRGSHKPCQRPFYLSKPLTTFESLLAFGPPVPAACG